MVASRWVLVYVYHFLAIRCEILYEVRFFREIVATEDGGGGEGGTALILARGETKKEASCRVFSGRTTIGSGRSLLKVVTRVTLNDVPNCFNPESVFPDHTAIMVPVGPAG